MLKEMERLKEEELQQVGHGWVHEEQVMWSKHAIREGGCARGLGQGREDLQQVLGDGWAAWKGGARGRRQVGLALILQGLAAGCRH
jgi:hypothetical protein